MANYRMTIQYDGTRYSGWQSQHATDATIQGKLETVLTRMTGQQVDVIGSGRTDAGVHAIGQVANFHLKQPRNTGELLDGLNRYLPEDIAVSSLTEVDERFHSRYQAVCKTYRYRIHTGAVPDVFARRYVYDYRIPLDVERMREAAGLLLGEHDFKSFCGNTRMKKSTVRTLYEIRVEEHESEIDLFFTGNGFLQNMVRILTGTLIEVGDGRREPGSMTDVLARRDRQAAGYTAPALGLALLFGFTLPKNFNHPYMADSVTDFWRRWHMSLSSWFRDYVYIPLGGSRCSKGRLVWNLFAVWSLTGLWHGANWTFVCWGLWFFVLLSFEKLVWGQALAKLPGILRHGYAMLVVFIGWIFFRSSSLSYAFSFLRALFVPGMGAPDALSWLTLCIRQYGLQLVICLLLSTNLGTKAWNALARTKPGRAVRLLFLLLVLGLSVLSMAGSGMQAFIYAQF